MIADDPAAVLMYHRIGDIPVDPWQLVVSEENFESHLKVLKKHFNVISLQELLQQKAAGKIKKNSICITFDDGYVDNFEKALPVLKHYDCPATFFIATGFVNKKEMFWWDVLTVIFLETPQLPPVLQVSGLNVKLDKNGGMTDSDFNAHKQWKWPAPPPTRRCEIYLSLWEYIRPLNADEILSMVNELIQWSGVDTTTQVAFAMNEQQLAQLSSDQLFSLGAHTVNHPALGSQIRLVQQAEITNSRDYLSGRFPNYLNAVAYPYGNYNDDTIDIVKTERFEAGFTTEAKCVNARSNIYQMGRFQVNNQTADEFKNNLKKWMRS